VDRFTFGAKVLRIVRTHTKERSIAMPVEDLRQSPMMGHMLDALNEGEDIGHYGRLVFAMIGRHFVSYDELVELLTKDHDTDEQEMRALVQQVEEKGYSPPRREKILEYQSQQDFPICPDPDDPDACNPYAELQFPDEVYESIQEYREERA
jgi:anaerobic ribonucleoside-triphosphate reductase